MGAIQNTGGCSSVIGNQSQGSLPGACLGRFVFGYQTGGLLRSPGNNRISQPRRTVGAFDIPEITQEVHPLLLLHVREGIKACVECTESMPATVSRDVLASDDLMGSRVVTGLVQHVKDLSIDLSIKVGSWSFRCTWSNRVFSSRKPSLDAEIRKEAGFP